MSTVSTSSWLAAFDGLVHASARHDSHQLIRHRAFMMSKYTAGCIGLASLPFCIAYFGMPSLADVGLLSFIALPFFAGVYASRTGRLDRAQAFAFIALAALTCGFSGISGGLGSPFLMLLAINVVEGALTGKLRQLAIALASGVTALSVSTVWALPQPFELSLLPLALLISFIGLMTYAYALACASSMPAVDDSAQRNIDNRFRAVAENAADMTTLHSRNGNMLFATGAAGDMLGESQLKATSLFDRVHVQDRPAFLKMFEEASTQNREARLQFRLREQVSDTYSYVETRCVPVKGMNQLVATTRILANQNVDEMERLAEDAEKANLAKSRFLAHVSHELRTPLNAIIGFSEMMSGKAGLKISEEKCMEYAGLIQDSGRHLLAVVNAILDLSKIESGSFALQPEPFQPCELAEKCLTMMEPAAAKGGVSLKTMSHGPLPEILADRRACKQILLNLLSNAVKFTPAGGKVALSLRCDSETVSFVVSDTGIGIDKADLPRLAQPFVQAQNTYDRQFEGTGLGLSLVKSLTELQGGTMRITSERGKGTVVTILLPRVATQQPETVVEQNVNMLKAAV